MMRYESPAKRPRVETYTKPTSDDIVLLLNQAITTTQRIAALHRLFAEIRYDFRTRACHCDPKVFLSLIESNVVGAIQLQLAFVVNLHGSTSEELDLTCTALDLFYRFFPELTSRNSIETRGSSVLQLLSEAYKDGIDLPVVSIWHSFSSKDYGAELLMKDQFSLRSVYEILLSDSSPRDLNLLIEILGFLKNMTFFSEGCRDFLVSEGDFLDALASTAFEGFSEKAAERLSAVIRNLTLTPHSRIILAEQSSILTCITRLSNNGNVATLRSLLNTVVGMAMESSSSIHLICHGDGLLVEMLKKLLSHPSDPVVRKRSCRAFKLLVRESTLPVLTNANVLMETLSHIALSDSDEDVRAEAAEAFGQCAGLAKAAMREHELILGRLSHLASSQPKSINAVTRALQEQVRNLENRSIIANRPHLLAMISGLGLSDEASRAAKERVGSILLELSNDEMNRPAMATPETLKVLVHFASDRSQRNSRVRELAIRALVNLSTAQANRKKMIVQSSLMQSLLSFASVTASNDMKQSVKTVLVRLATEL